MFEEFLQEIGLSEKEARVYVALLQVDSANIHDLAIKTGINRTTVYPVLESLEKKGLVSETQDGKKTTYHAASPERLETYIERQRVMLEEQTARLKDVIPQMKAIQRESGERPIVKYFEGRDGAISAYAEFMDSIELTTGEETGYFLFNRNLLEKTFTQEELGRFRDIREGKNVQPITVYNHAGGDFTFRTPGTRIRIDETRYPILCDISIIQDKVVITTLGDKVSAFLIKSTDIAETLKNLVRKINNI